MMFKRRYGPSALTSFFRVGWAGAGPLHRDQPIWGAPPGDGAIRMIPSSPAQAPSGSGSFSTGWCPLWASECVCFGRTSCRRTLNSGLTDGGSWQYLT